MPREMLIFFWCIASGVVFSLGADPVVYSIEPTHGSLAGGTMVFVHGRGFANDQFNFHDPLLGNKILFKSDKHQVECHITPTDVSEKRIGCETEPSPTVTDGEYELVMFVNGALVTRYCGRHQKCTFQFYKWRTPTIDDFTPRAAIPGTPVEIFGKIHTTQFSRLSPGFSADNKEITRIYVGLECNPFNDETNELFGAELEDCGWTPNCRGSFQCLPKTRTPGSHSASYLVSLLGRSQVNKNLWRVDANQELYLYQTHSDIQSVSPSSGSLLGGTILTIRGKGFSDIAKNVKVFVAGVECEVLSSSLTQIKCRTGPKQDVRSNYPGSRGLLREIWTATVKSNLADIAALQSSAADFHFEYLTESSCEFLKSCLNMTVQESEKSAKES